MKKTILILMVFSLFLIGGCIEEGTIKEEKKKNQTITLTKDDFTFMHAYWLNAHLHNDQCKQYERTGRCREPNYNCNDLLWLKYKISNVKKEHLSYGILYCNAYDGAVLIESGYDDNVASHEAGDELDIVLFPLPLEFNKGHDLTICCYIRGHYLNNTYYEQSNEICVNRHVDSTC